MSRLDRVADHLDPPRDEFIAQMIARAEADADWIFPGRSRSLEPLERDNRPRTEG